MTVAVVHAAQPSRKAPPGDLAMWFFICAELLVFGILFLAYAFARARNVELFNSSQASLDRVSGLINTLLLIAGSWAVARAVAAIQQGQGRGCSRWLWLGFLLGGAFAVNKVLEFGHTLGAGITLSTNTFYMFYLLLTLFHFFHVLLGMVILAAVAIKAGQGGYRADEHAGVETAASYWHMVDLVWIVLFPLVYILR